MKRYAIIRNADSREQLEAFLPSGYSVIHAYEARERHDLRLGDRPEPPDHEGDPGMITINIGWLVTTFFAGGWFGAHICVAIERKYRG